MVESIKSKLLREEVDYIHQMVDTVCIREYPNNFNHIGRRVGPFVVGHPYRLEHYIARIFVEQGYLRFDDKNILNSSAIQKINFQETTNPEPRKIQDYVYVQAMEQLRILQKLEDKNPAAQKEFRKLHSDLNDLIRVRLAKVNRLANQTPDLKVKKYLSPEEVILFDMLSETIQQWREHLSIIN